MQFTSISHSEISVTLTDEGLVKFYHFVSQYGPFFDRNGSFVSPLPWLRNEKHKKEENFVKCTDDKTSRWWIST